MKKITKLLVCLMLAVSLIFLSMSAIAMESELDNELTISTTAGMHGCYKYNMETGEETFLPPPTSVEHNKVVPSTGFFDEEPVNPRWVIGTDNRMIVKNPTNERSTICLLGVRTGPAEGQVGHGTGWLINKNHVVTAGHCLYSDNWSTSNSNGSHYAQHVAVYVGASGGKFTQYKFATELYAAADYRDHNSTEQEYQNKGKFDDWGVITLSSPVNNTSFMGLHAVNNANEMYSQYYTAGYPKDKNEKVHDRWDSYDMYWAAGKILGDLPGPRYLAVVRTDLDVTEGQSGSPVYAYRNSSEGYCAEAIVIARDENVWEPENHLLLINDWLVNELTTTFS